MLKSLPPATRAILVANVVMYLLLALLGPQAPAIYLLELWPMATQLFEPWQVLTYAFLHANFMHLFFNMFAVYMFGSALEQFWGPRRYLVYYFASVLAAGFTQLTVTALTHTPYPTLGASGGVFGLLLAFAFYFPKQRVTLLFPPIPMPAWLFVTLYGALELVLGVTGTQEGVAHFAHLGGMLGGALVILVWRVIGASRRPPYLR